eukprot:scaffold78947_cov41-Attheya_sp.AAC.1
MTSIGLLVCLLAAIAVEFCFIALLLTVHVSSRSRKTAHMEPHPAREWIQMTPMDIVNVELLFYCLLATVHVSSRSWMTAHVVGMDPDDINGHR